MKKLIAVILTLALSTLAVAMAETTDYLGTWYLNEMTMVLPLSRLPRWAWTSPWRSRKTVPQS